MGILPKEEDFDQESYEGDADELEQDLLEEKEEVKARAVQAPTQATQKSRGRPIGSTKTVAPQAQQAQEAAEEKITSRYEAFHQRENIGIVDTVTGEMIGGFADEGSAAAMALMLNKQNKMMVAAGYD